jgi:hypothetical protein
MFNGLTSKTISSDSHSQIPLKISTRFAEAGSQKIELGRTKLKVRAKPDLSWVVQLSKHFLHLAQTSSGAALLKEPGSGLFVKKSPSTLGLRSTSIISSPAQGRPWRLQIWSLPLARILRSLCKIYNYLQRQRCSRLERFFKVESNIFVFKTHKATLGFVEFTPTIRGLAPVVYLIKHLRPNWSFVLSIPSFVLVGYQRLWNNNWIKLCVENTEACF